MVLLDLLCHLVNIIIYALLTALGTLVVTNISATLLVDTHCEVEVRDAGCGIRSHIHSALEHRGLITNSNRRVVSLKIECIEVEERLRLGLLKLTQVKIVASLVVECAVVLAADHK